MSGPELEALLSPSMWLQGHYILTFSPQLARQRSEMTQKFLSSPVYVLLSHCVSRGHSKFKRGWKGGRWPCTQQASENSATKRKNGGIDIERIGSSRRLERWKRLKLGNFELMCFSHPCHLSFKIIIIIMHHSVVCSSTRHFSLGFIKYSHVNSSWSLYNVATFIMHVFQMRKLKLRKIEWLANILQLVNGGARFW